MAGNTGYQINSGSQTVSLPAYTAFGTEFSVTKTWEAIWLRKFALLAMIKDGKATWNKGSKYNGTQMLIPVALADASTPAAGVLNSAEFTAITPYGTNGFTEASYQTAHYRGAFFVKASEDKKINNQRGGGFLQGKIDQMVKSFINVMANDLASSNADSEAAILGVQQVLSTSNTVGGINQSTDTDWASNVTTGAGAFSMDLLDIGIDAVDNRGGKVTLVQLAYSSSNNLFSKARAALGPAERLVNQEFSAKYGFTTIQYLDATLISDGRLTAGVMCGFDPTTWYYAGDDAPSLHHVQPVTGTDANEHVYNLFASLGCSNPSKNFRITGVS